jgi:lipopolysaccharide export system permease protein
VFLRITGPLVPILMLVIAPIAIMIAVSYALIKLNGDSELVVMNAAGIAPRRVYRPVLAACIFVAVFVGFISAYLAPLLQRQMNEAISKVRTDVVANIVRPGAFTPVERGLIFHIRDRLSENQFRGIFIDDSRNATERATIVADYGQIVQRRGHLPGMRDTAMSSTPDQARSDHRGVRPVRLRPAARPGSGFDRSAKNTSGS